MQNAIDWNVNEQKVKHSKQKGESPGIKAAIAEIRLRKCQLPGMRLVIGIDEKTHLETQSLRYKIAEKIMHLKSIILTISSYVI